MDVSSQTPSIRIFKEKYSSVKNSKSGILSKEGGNSPMRGKASESQFAERALYQKRRNNSHVSFRIAPTRHGESTELAPN